MATTYSGWSDGWKPSGSSVTKHYRARLDASGSIYDDTRYRVNAYVYANVDSSVTAYFKGRLAGTGQTTYTSGTVNMSFEGSNTVTTLSNYNYYWTRTTENYTVSVTGYAWSDKKDWDGYWVGTTQSFTVPALESYAVEFDANTGSGEMEDQTKYYGIDLTLPECEFEKSAYSFKEWNTAADGSGDTYLPSTDYTLNAGITLYAIWQPEYPPKCDYSELTDFANYSKYNKTFSEIGVTIDTDSIWVYEGRRFKEAVITVGTDSCIPMDLTDLETANGEIYTTVSSSGTLPVTLTIQDEIYDEDLATWVDGAIQPYVLGNVEVDNPTWTIEAVFDEQYVKIPDLDVNGNSDIIVYAKNYTTNNFDVVAGTYNAVEDGLGNWSILVTLDETHVDDPTDTSPNGDIKVEYHHTDTEEREAWQAFYKTTRNANFSTGISNTMFVSGCDATNYSSRVWWSQINNPLYFPDTNYVEVGSNDTSVMGLCKVGDYLGVVKQSKTTDTAIFLVYPTSFEDDTTYAVKQLSSGVGAYGKYTFNVLGDETLFLSPNGVMAIVPSEDNDHKVQNRSYFVDGKLLKESQIQDAYSFVFDGKYYLAVNNHCYVLDGNQRNSWGNDKTNLVYECYYLDGVPADCFVRYNDSLMFSNDYGLCKFKAEDDSNAYTDSYDGENIPVSARWSTLLDDDNALNYYKTMQKKGNAVSILPNTPFKFTVVAPTEEEFNENKTNYWIFSVDTGDYVRCTSESVYDENMQYYVKEPTNTKVFVRKDNNEPVEIKRSFSELTEIPSELFINKKFKKYKRLQFILENNENEPFGVDSIVKQYTVGNYAKR